MRLKKVGLLTSGGDAPGMNAAIRSFTRYAVTQGITVLGINRGYVGLRTADMYEMNLRTVSDILHRGGTILYSSRDHEFETEEGTQSALKTYMDHELDALVIIGGNGSLKGVKALKDKGAKCIFIPATIDNDISYTEYSIGFDTAMNTALEMIDKIRDTTRSHEKCSVVEVMGRKCGDLALNIGIGVGATSILVPEITYDFEKDIINRIKYTQNIGKRHFIIVIAEGCEKSLEISKKIEEQTGITTRCTILGHVQRGGSPTVRDRVIASGMGYYAAQLLLEGNFNRAIALACDKIIDYDIDSALKIKKKFNLKLYKEALNISI